MWGDRLSPCTPAAYLRAVVCTAARQLVLLDDWRRRGRVALVPHLHHGGTSAVLTPAAALLTSHVPRAMCWEGGAAASPTPTCSRPPPGMEVSLMAAPPHTAASASSLQLLVSVILLGRCREG